ncbi:hypothetical protein EDB87DRAFT_1579460 [Lactarius vividus]|nr:hypothetical protein EDB87DRAFT_1579460 [Lactarius vividus]
MSSPPEVATLLHLNNLNLLVFVDSYLGGYRQNHPLWERFSSLIYKMIAAIPDPPHGAHFRHELHGTRVRIWVAPSEQGLPSSPWPPLDDLYSLEIRYSSPGYCMPWNPIADYNASSFCHLQQFCAALGGSSIKELLVNCEMGLRLNITHIPEFPQLCWQALFSGSPFLRKLHFGVGVTELLASTLKAITTGPSFDEEEPNSNVLSSGLQWVIIDRGEFCTHILWKWIHYAVKFALLAMADYFDLRKDVLALLSKRHWGSMDIKPMEDSTKALVVFLLRCGSRDDSVFKLVLVECKWDEPYGLEILRWKRQTLMEPAISLVNDLYLHWLEGHKFSHIRQNYQRPSPPPRHHHDIRVNYQDVYPALSPFRHSLLKTAEEHANRLPADIDYRALEWALNSLNEDDELEQFFDSVPSFCDSKAVETPLGGFVKPNPKKLTNALTRLMDRPLAPPTFLDPGGSYPALSLDWTRVDRPITTFYAQCAVSAIISSMQIPSYLDHGDSILLANLIHIIRQTLRTRSLIEKYHDGYITKVTSRTLESISKLDVQDSLPELQHEFCRLWNQLVHIAQDDKYWNVTLATQERPEAFATTDDNDITLDDITSYPICTIPSHEPTHSGGLSDLLGQAIQPPALPLPALPSHGPASSTTHVPFPSSSSSPPLQSQVQAFLVHHGVPPTDQGNSTLGTNVAQPIP